MNCKAGLIFFLFVLPFILPAQNSSNDLALISAHIQEHTNNSPARTVHLQKTYNPAKAFLYVSLYLYQKIISEQISANCEFNRSCSNFSIAAIREFGIIKGVCLSADRLTRCNGQAQVESESYLINHANGKTIDEPSMYRYKK